MTSPHFEFLPLWGFGGYVIGNCLAFLHEMFERHRDARAYDRMLRAEREVQIGAKLSTHYARVLLERARVVNTSTPTVVGAYDRMLREVERERRASRGLHSRIGERAEIEPPPPGTPFDWGTDPRFAPSRALLRQRLGKDALGRRLAKAQRDLRAMPDTAHPAALPVANLNDTYRRAREHQRILAEEAAADIALRRTPKTWRCDKCGYTETLTDDEVALRADGLGDLWTSHWPARAEGDAADILCDGRFICIGRVG